jgi:VIT1/CCC1 family predicted Fe2+/Mn2+ transporter
MKNNEIQTEVDTSYLYKVLSAKEKDPIVASIFKQMSEIEHGHALAFMKKNGIDPIHYPKPSIRAKMLNGFGKIFGYNLVLGAVLDTEKNLSNSIIQIKRNRKQTPSISDTSHVSILRNILHSNKIGGADVTRFEKRHRSIGGNALRAAVLGGNDGLVSNFSLVMGIAGAMSGQKEVLLTGLAGLLAGALSMALGEWISVKSSQELSENQIQLEKEEFETNPEGEEKELALIYITKGIPEEQAKTMAANLMKNKSQAQEMLIREELGINQEELKGSAMVAALSSFILFALGAIIPVIPFFFWEGYPAIIISASLSALGLFMIGAFITMFTGKSIWFSGGRQMLFGLIAAGITFGIGKLIGVSLV